MRFGTVKYSVKQGVKNIARNRMFSIASIATMAACIFLFGIFYSIITNFNYIVEKAEEGVAIVVFFDEEATDERVSAIGDKLRNHEGVLEVKYVSGEEALSEVCTEYPRFTIEYGNVIQKCLSLSCEEVGRLVFTRDDSVSIIEFPYGGMMVDEEDRDSEIQEEKEDGEGGWENEAYEEIEAEKLRIKFLEQVQAWAIAILQDKRQPIEERMKEYLCFAEVIQQRINTGQVNHSMVRSLNSAGFLLHRNAWEIAHMLVGAGKGIEERSFATVLVACQSENHRLSSFRSIFLASSRRMVSS